MYFRHRISKAVEQGSKSPGEDWDRIAGPEAIDTEASPTVGVQDAPIEAPPVKIIAKDPATTTPPSAA